MQASLEQSTLVAEQRLVGATLGAAIQCLCTPRIEGNARLRRSWSPPRRDRRIGPKRERHPHAAAIVGCALTSSGLSHPAGRDRRVLFTFARSGSPDRHAARQPTPEAHSRQSAADARLSSAGCCSRDRLISCVWSTSASTASRSVRSTPRRGRSDHTTAYVTRSVAARAGLRCSDGHEADYAAIPGRHRRRAATPVKGAANCAWNTSRPTRPARYGCTNNPSSISLPTRSAATRSETAHQDRRLGQTTA